MVVGELTGGLSDRATAIAQMFADARIDARASGSMEIELWQKFVFITAMAAVCGLARASIGPVRDAPGGRRLIERAVTEVVAVARARGGRACRTTKARERAPTSTRCPGL
jgi:2-dehydropantoate 2-reductase